MSKKTEGSVGIFWVLPVQRLICDTTPLSLAERYGRFLIHSGSHIDVWERLRRAGSVPQHVEYDDSPRGRIAYDIVTERFSALADRCILADKLLVSLVRDRFRLPENAN